MLVSREQGSVSFSESSVLFALVELVAPLDVVLLDDGLVAVPDAGLACPGVDPPQAVTAVSAMAAKLVRMMREFTSVPGWSDGLSGSAGLVEVLLAALVRCLVGVH